MRVDVLGFRAMLWLGVVLVDLGRVVHVILSRVVLCVRQSLGRGESVTEVCTSFCLLVCFTLRLFESCGRILSIQRSMLGLIDVLRSILFQSPNSLSSIGASCQVRSCEFVSTVSTCLQCLHLWIHQGSIWI